MNQITPEQLLIKIGLLVMENDILRAQIIEYQKEEDLKKDKKGE